MKARQSILALALLLVLGFMQGEAGAGNFVDGNRLVQSMREYEKSEPGAKTAGVSWVEVGHYQGYVNGVFDICDGVMWESPENVTGEQVYAIVSKYLKSHSKRWNEPAKDLIIDALRESFPLKKR